MTYRPAEVAPLRYHPRLRGRVFLHCLDFKRTCSATGRLLSGSQRLTHRMLTVARDFVDAKWAEHQAPGSRRLIAEAHRRCHHCSVRRTTAGRARRPGARGVVGLGVRHRGAHHCASRRPPCRERAARRLGGGALLDGTAQPADPRPCRHRGSPDGTRRSVTPAGRDTGRTEHCHPAQAGFRPDREIRRRPRGPRRKSASGRAVDAAAQGGGRRSAGCRRPPAGGAAARRGRRERSRTAGVLRLHLLCRDQAG